MTELYLNGHRVFFDDGQQLKVTRENPLLTKSGAFSLDVKLPMDIKENVDVIGMINRIDVKRRYTTFSCILLAEGRAVLDGTAVVTGVSEDSVKVQLLSGNSEVRFWDKAKKQYIDSTDSGYWDTPAIDNLNRWILAFHRADQSIPFSPNGTGNLTDPGLGVGKWNTVGVPGVGVFMPIYDETNDIVVNDHMHKNDDVIYVHVDAVQPNFMMVLRTVISKMGYSLSLDNMDVSLLNSIYIASARRGFGIANALPHWTVKEFIENVQDFLNCTFVFDDIMKTATIMDNSSVTGMMDISDCILGEFNAEIVSDDDVDHNIVSSNVAYAERGGESDIDMVNIDVLKAFENVEYPSLNAVSLDASSGRNAYKIYVTPEGKFVYDEGVYHKVDHFGALVKDKENVDNRYELKIVPCRTILEEFKVEGNGLHELYFAMATKLSIVNQFEPADNETAWTAVNDNEVDNGTEKEDIMQVFLIDDIHLTTPITRFETVLPFHHPDEGMIGKKVYYPMPFTERGLNMPDNCAYLHEDWSLALANCKCQKFVGRWFNDGVKQDDNVELEVSFVVKSLPSVTDLYYIKGKKYRCKKIEMNFDAEGMKSVVKGYFVALE